MREGWNMKGKAPILIYALPLLLSLIGMLCNSIGFVYNKFSPLNFLFSAAFCIAWIIIFVFAPSYRKKSVQIYLLVWWTLSMIFGIGHIFSYFLTGGRAYDWRIVPDLMFVVPIAGVQYAAGDSHAGKYMMIAVMFCFTATAISQFLIAHNMWPEQDREQHEQVEQEKSKDEE